MVGMLKLVYPVHVRDEAISLNKNEPDKAMAKVARLTTCDNPQTDQADNDRGNPGHKPGAGHFFMVAVAVLGNVNSQSHNSRHALRPMFVSRVLRLRTLHLRLFTTKSTAATPKAVQEQTAAAGTPQTGGE